MLHCRICYYKHLIDYTNNFKRAIIRSEVQGPFWLIRTSDDYIYPTSQRFIQEVWQGGHMYRITKPGTYACVVHVCIGGDCCMDFMYVHSL